MFMNCWMSEKTIWYVVILQSLLFSLCTLCVCVCVCVFLCTFKSLHLDVISYLWQMISSHLKTCWCSFQNCPHSVVKVSWHTIEGTIQLTIPDYWSKQSEKRTVLCTYIHTDTHNAHIHTDRQRKRQICTHAPPHTHCYSDIHFST